MSNKKKGITILCVLLVLTTVSLVILAVCGIRPHTANNNLTSSNRSTITMDENGKATDGKYKEKTKEEILAELNKNQVNVTDKISSSAEFKNGLKGCVGSFVVENLPSNNVIVQCEVFRGKELLSKSVPIYPNEHIETIELLTSMNSGTYDAVVYINYFKLDTKEFISKAGYKIKIIIK